MCSKLPGRKAGDFTRSSRNRPESLRSWPIIRRSMTPGRTVHEMFPGFALELEQLSREGGRPEVASQIGALPVVARCTCGQGNCAHFYTAPPPDGAYGEGHSNLLLPSKRGL